MIAPDFPVDEAERLLALQQTGLLDSAPEERFDRVTRLAARFFNVQTCVVSLIDSERQWFKSRVGLEEEETEREISFCAHAILRTDILVVPDATRDARFSGNPFVIDEPHIRFYAGAPLREPGGQNIGTLCLLDSTAREFNEEHKAALRDFADVIESEIANVDQAEFQRKLAASMTRMAMIISTLPDMVFVVDRYFRILVCSEHPDLVMPRHKILGRTIEEVLSLEMGEQLKSQVAQAFNSDAVIDLQLNVPSLQKTFESRARKIDRKEVLVIIRNTTEQTQVNARLERLSEVARQTTNGVIITDTQGLTVWINEALTRITGYQLDDMLGKQPGKLLQGEDTDPATVKTMAKALASNKGFNVDALNYTKKGKAIWLRIACNPLWSDSGELQGFIAIESDVTREKLDAEKIQHNESMIKSVIDANTIGTWRLNLQTRELQINDQWAALLGYRRSELMPINQDTWENLTHPDDLAYSLNQIKKHTTGQVPTYEANIRMCHKKDYWVWINTRGQMVSRTADGKPEWLLGTHFDISARILAEKTLKEQSMQMQAIVDNMLDGVISIDGRGIVLTFNRAAEQIFGYSSGEMIGRNISVLMDSPHREHHDSYLSNYIGVGVGNVIGRNRELEAVHKDGTVFPIELGLAEVDQAGRINFIGIVRDITQRKRAEEEVRLLAFYDSLTKLPNRRLLMDRLQHVIANCARQDVHAALLFLDMDNFKDLNDSAGHRKGDELLCQVAQRLSLCVRQSDTVSRLGGDEFVVVVEDLSSDANEAANQAECVAEKIIDQLSRTFDLDGLAYTGSASVGVTMFNSNGDTPSDLLKQADMAMYKAKAAGRNGIRFFDPQMQVAVSLRAALEQDMHDALRQQQFVLYYQKQIDQHGKTIGTEVLLRWLHPDKGLVSPAQFIPLAEESGLIIPIGKWVLQTACETLAQWASEPDKAHLTIAVNMSVVQFREDDIVQIILEALKTSGAPARRLKLELTESLLASNFQDVKDKMLALQQHGVSFSIDDFGTGYSSLLYLKQLPLNQLKIDQSFVRDITSSPNDQAIAQAIITLAEALAFNVIAEGVETEEQRVLLQELGCDNYQGYLYGKPCPLEELFS